MDARAIKQLHQINMRLVRVGRERNYRSQEYWDAVFALSTVLMGLVQEHANG